MPKRKTKSKAVKRTSKSKTISRAESKTDTFEQRMKDFGEEIETIGDRFGKRMEKRGKCCESWFHRTFGLVGPLISSILGIIIIGLIAWVISLLNVQIGSMFLFNVHYFLMENMGLFFLIFLFFSYTSHVSKFYQKAYMPFSPLVIAVGITIGFWIVMSAINVVNLSLGYSVLSSISFYIGKNLFLIFWLVLFIGYLIFLIKLALEAPLKRVEEFEKKIVAEKTTVEKAESGGVRRIYRSGKDKILGGVCGGIAEYLGVDPVIIRLLWVIGAFAWGFGVLLYIIAWIIIPRNPNHKWK